MASNDEFQRKGTLYPYHMAQLIKVSFSLLKYWSYIEQ